MPTSAAGAATLVAPDDHWVLWAVLLSAAAFGLWSERTRWGARLSAVLVSMGTTFVLTNAGVLPPAAPAYDVVWDWLVPLSVPLLLLRANLVKILREAGPTLVAFAIGAVATVAGTVAAFRAVDLGPDGWKLAGMYCATYVGGTMNFVAVAEALQMRSGDLVAAANAADNLAMGLYFLVLSALPSIAPLRRLYASRHREAEAGDESVSGLAAGKLPDLLGAASALALAAAFCAAGWAASAALGWKGGRILVVTALTVLAATVAPKLLARLEGAEMLGMLSMQVFFAVIGASASIAAVAKAGPGLFVFAALLLAIHLVLILAGGWLARLDLLEVVIASNANVGGPTTAAAMAASRRWSTLVLPGILCGTLGYAIANFIGVAVARFLKP